jgi:hypothetical protein
VVSYVSPVQAEVQELQTRLLLLVQAVISYVSPVQVEVHELQTISAIVVPAIAIYFDSRHVVPQTVQLVCNAAENCPDKQFVQIRLAVAVGVSPYVPALHCVHAMQVVPVKELED